MQDRDDGQGGVKVAQPQQAGDGAVLVLGDGQAGPGRDGGFAHPVLGGGPGQVADLVAVAADPGRELAGCRAVIPAAVPGQFGETAGVQRPVSGSAGQGPIAAQPAVGDEQRQGGGAQPAGVVSAEEEGRASGGRPRARSLLGSGRESQHRAGGMSHGRWPVMPGPYRPMACGVMA